MTGPTWYMTLGSRYAREPHPLLPGAHPDGWFEVRGAATQPEAREWVTRAAGTRWAAIYSTEQWEADRMARSFPRGCLGVIQATRVETLDY